MSHPSVRHMMAAVIKRVVKINMLRFNTFVLNCQFWQYSSEVHMQTTLNNTMNRVGWEKVAF